MENKVTFSKSVVIPTMLAYSEDFREESQLRGYLTFLFNDSFAQSLYDKIEVGEYFYYLDFTREVYMYLYKAEEGLYDIKKIRFNDCHISFVCGCKGIKKIHSCPDTYYKPILMGIKGGRW